MAPTEAGGHDDVPHTGRSEQDMTCRRDASGYRLLAYGINYHPEPTGTALNTTGLLEGLASLGWDVTVVTGVPHYPAWRRQPATPLAKRNGVRIVRRWHFVPRDPRLVRRGIYELSWIASSTPTLLRNSRPDVVLGVVPSLGGAVLACGASVRYQVPYVLMVQDLMGPSAKLAGVPGGSTVAGALEFVETALARRASRVAVAAPSFEDYFVTRGVSRGRVVRFRNPARLKPVTRSRCDTRTELGWSADEFVVLHSGSMGYKQGLETVLQAADLCARDQVRFVLQGSGSQRPHLEQLARDMRLRNVTFLPIATEDEYPNVLAAADALLLHQRLSVNNMALPAKLGSYFAAGVPVIAAVASTDEVVHEMSLSNGGVVITPEDPSALVEAINALRASPAEARRLGLNGKRFAAATLSPEAPVRQLAAVFDEVVAHRFGAN